jgi:AcrR family transcriptional regulator
VDTATGTVARRRQRNARGQGARLTGDIVAGALAVIEREGSAEAVTLRAVAREVGIAAPSIYAHFPDRDAILRAVIAQIFDELAAAIRQGEEAAGADPVGRLIAGCEAYVSFGLADPARYGVLFSARRMASQDYEPACPPGPDGRPALAQGADAFALLVTGIEDCVSAGVCASTDPMADATALWVGLHGTVSLRSALTGRFPWPDLHEFVRNLVLTLGKVTVPGAAQKR